MDFTLLIGLGAAFCTTVAFVPQAMKSLKTRDTASLSLGMYAILTTGVFLWLSYGIILRDIALVAANGITFVLSLAILIMKIRYDVLKRPTTPRSGRPPKTHS